VTNQDKTRFFDKIKQTISCWLWMASTDSDGYGRFWMEGKHNQAHRVAVRLDGRDPEGKVVRHTCDVPHCVNPAHLRLGTHADNVADRQRRDRQAKGGRNGRAKLCADDIPTIRRRVECEPVAHIAREYEVSPRAIRKIRDRETWKHV
jgi:hypothetical protein